jgi:uncharacterized protein (TIGR02996 family)
MSDADFLRIILAEPDSDGPRLVYADWLDEHGQSARAEFIRVQCARSRLSVSDSRVPFLKERESVLLEQNRVPWSAPLSGLATKWDFVRGFPDQIRVEAGAFLTHAETLFRVVPVRHLELHDIQKWLSQLSRSPYLSRLAGLKLTGGRLGDAAAKALAQSPYLEQLQVLDLGRQQIGNDGAKALAAAENLHGLTSLELSDNAIGAEGASALAASPHLGRLKTLNLRSNPIGPAGAEALLTSSRLVQLKSLNIAYAQVGVSAFESLSDAGASAHFALLDLAGNALGDVGASSFVQWSGLANLRELDLSRNEIGDPGAAAIVESPHLTSLRRLALNGNHFSETIGKRRLTSWAHLHRVAALELRENSPLAALRR